GAAERRNVVIGAMNAAGSIDGPTMDSSLAAPLQVERGSLDTADAPYFVDLVRAQLAQRYDPKDLTTQNLSIHTTLDLRLQAIAQNALEKGLDNVAQMINPKQHPPLHP